MKGLSDQEEMVLEHIPLCHLNAIPRKDLAEACDLTDRVLRDVISKLIEKGRLVYRGNLGIFIPRLDCEICISNYKKAANQEFNKGKTIMNSAQQMAMNFNQAFQMDEFELMQAYNFRKIF